MPVNAFPVGSSLGFGIQQALLLSYPVKYLLDLDGRSKMDEIWTDDMKFYIRTVIASKWNASLLEARSAEF